MKDSSDIAGGLKPCPFCGSQPSINRFFTESLFSHDQVEYLTISCGECDLALGSSEQQNELIEAWNTRPPTVASPVLCEDCPPNDYPTNKTRCTPCPRRSAHPSPPVAPVSGDLVEGSARELRSDVSSPIVDGDLPDLDALEAVAQAATPGRWQNGIDDLDGVVAPDNPGLGNVICIPPLKSMYSSLEHWPENAAHIAAFDPPTTLALIASNRALTARVEALEAGLKSVIASADGEDPSHHDEEWKHGYASGLDDAAMIARAALQGVG